MKITPAERKQLALVLHEAESLLAENLMPFWAENAWDVEHGGFLTRLDRRGRRLEDAEKVLMMQVRMIFALSAAHRHGLDDRGYLERAGQGFDFLVRTMWDRDKGGFFFSVARDGTLPCPRKNTDFHGYALTGLTEYASVSGRAEAREYAGRLFDVLVTQAADGDWGYVEDFDGGDWDALNAEQMNLAGQQDIKTIDMHTNIMEGLMYLCRMTGAPAHLTALRRVVNLICAKGIDPEHCCSVTVFDRHWKPLADSAGKATTSYGINVEIAWILLEAVDVLHAPREEYRPIILGLIDHALAYGFDHERGGLAAYGPPTGSVLDALELPENRLLKSWWAQAEMLNALVAAWQWTRQPKYLDAFLKEFDWICRFQIDHECGDWYQDTDWTTGHPLTTDKGNEFKTAFHAGRALIRVADTLRVMLEG